MASKIYTRVGDKGSTSLIGGTKVSKADIRLEAYGTIDELNSYLGVCRDLQLDERSTSSLLEIQDRLFTIGSALACDPEKETRLAIPDLLQSDIDLLEKEMDAMNESLPEMKHFIIPGGNLKSSHLHVARCICRRAERVCVRIEIARGEEDLVRKYLNRLSDYLFVLSRYIAFNEGSTEQPWRPRLAG